MLQITDNLFTKIKDLTFDHPDQEHFVAQTLNGNVYLFSEFDINIHHDKDTEYCDCYCLVQKIGPNNIGVTKLHRDTLVKILWDSELKLK